MKFHIGCSGFHYKEWKGSFYPQKLPQRRWFEYYCSQFDCLELNVSFYRFPRVSFLRTWYDQSPESFVFSVKAPRLITHYKRFKDCQRYLDDFYGTIAEGLGQKLGPVLFQLTPQSAYSDDMLERIIGAMRPGFQNVIEFRHNTWWNNAVYTALSAKRICFCGMNHPSLPQEPVVNAGVVYYRFHGAPKLYFSSYSNAELEEVAEQIALSFLAKEVYIFFNNTATMAALDNARWLKRWLGQEIISAGAK